MSSATAAFVTPAGKVALFAQRKALVFSFAGRNRDLQKGALPQPTLDPNPASTIALFKLWAAMRPSLGLTDKLEPTLVIPEDDPDRTPSEAFDSFREELVSLLFLLLSIKGLINPL